MPTSSAAAVQAAPPETLPLSELGSAAVAYAEQGWAVFPCEPRGKKPLIQGGFKSATTDPATISEWWERFPDANIGGAVPSGIVVVDVDSQDALRYLEIDDRPLPATTKARTSRGWHFLYREQRPLRQRAPADGVDLRTAGSGYVILPPSIHETGAEYAWEVAPGNEADAPEWIYECAGADRPAPAAPVNLVGAGAIVSGVSEGNRNGHLFRLALSLRRTGFPREDADLVILQNASRCTPALPEREAVEIVEGVYRRYAPDAGVMAQIEAAAAREAASGRVPVAVNLDDLLTREISPRRWLVPGLIQEKDTAMVFAPRGTGKTYFVLSLGYAVACGSPFLKFPIDHPAGVLLVDGEMPAEDLQERLARIAAAGAATRREPFKILSADLLEDGIATLASPRGQQIVEANLDGVKLVIIDSISTLCGGQGRENDAESWEAMQAWLLSLRRKGVAVLLVHHAGKGGDQRGTSKREDVLTQVLKLSRPAGYCPSEGAVFEARFTKSRGLTGDAAKPFEAKLAAAEDGGLLWTWRDLEESITQRVEELTAEGMKPAEIAADLGIDRSTVYRHLKRRHKEAAAA